MESIIALAERNQQRAWEIIEDLDLANRWKTIGAEANLVGSLKTKLLVKHRDIDFHIYSSSLSITGDFSVMAQLAEHPAITKVEYINLLHTDEQCLEWHAWYMDQNQELWQLDMIHIVKGSYYDGYFEQVAERINAVLTAETRQAIIKIKYDLPETVKAMGIDICRAVIADGVRDYTEFAEWQKKQPDTGIVEWCP